MNKYLLLVVAFSLVQTGNIALAECPYCNDSGCCYEDVVKYRCVQVPDKKPVKKIFYECKCIPFCTAPLPPFFGCECESDCSCPRFKHVLIKREVQVGEICTTKCVIEEYVERVQVPCCHCDFCEAQGSSEEPQQAPKSTRRAPSRDYPY